MVRSAPAVDVEPVMVGGGRGNLPEHFPKLLPTAVRPDRLTIGTFYCRACGHHVELHPPVGKPWRCHYADRQLPRVGAPCGCTGYEHDLLDAYVADWVARRGAAARPGIPEAVKAAVVARDGMVCRYCARRVHRRRRGPGRLHFDHVIPWSKGGRHTVANLVVSCARCNLDKHDDATVIPAGWDRAAFELEQMGVRDAS